MSSHSDSNQTQNSSRLVGITRTSEGRARFESHKKCHNEKKKKKEPMKPPLRKPKNEMGPVRM